MPDDRERGHGHRHQDNGAAADRVWLRRALVALLIAFSISVFFAVRMTHHGVHRPQVAVVAHEPSNLARENDEKLKAIADELKQKFEPPPVVEAPAPVAEAAPVTDELKPSVDLPSDTTVANAPVATAADEAQFAQENHSSHVSFFRPHHHRHHPARPAHAGASCGGDYVADFFCDTARAAGLIQ